MSSLSAKARFARLGGRTGTQVVVPPPGETPPDTPVPVALTIVDASTARVAAVTDNNQIIEFTNSGAITYTIKAYADVPLPIGAVLIAQQGDAGKVTFVPDGVTFETSDSYTTRKQESFIAMKHVSLDRWIALGDLETSLTALSVLGRSANTDGAMAAITASANLQVLMRRASALVFDLIGMGDITGLVAALALKADITYVDAAIAALIDSSPSVLDTLNELAAALGDDPNFATTMAATLAVKASIVQVQQGTLVFAAAGGTADAITATLAPVPTLVDGMEVRIRASGANTVTNPTLNVNGLGALTIFKFGGVALAAGDIYGAGHELTLRYRASVPRWELKNPAVTGGASYTDEQVRDVVAAAFAAGTHTGVTFAHNDPSDSFSLTATVTVDIRDTWLFG